MAEIASGTGYKRELIKYLQTFLKLNIIWNVCNIILHFQARMPSFLQLQNSTA